MLWGLISDVYVFKPIYTFNLFSSGCRVEEVIFPALLFFCGRFAVDPDHGQEKRMVSRGLQRITVRRNTWSQFNTMEKGLAKVSLPAAILRLRSKSNSFSKRMHFRRPDRRNHSKAMPTPARFMPTFLQPSRTPAPATYLVTCRNPCACHAKHTLNLKKRPETVSFWRFWLPNRSRARAWCKFCETQLPKVVRTSQFLTILASESLSRAGVVQILRSSTSKSAPTMPVFNDFDFQIALARRRGANFVEISFQKCPDTASF